ncbi:hypothetical protein ABZ839_03615 [Streptomyces cellulosae]
MSHASATTVTPHSARVTEAASAQPLLVVETLDHSAGSALLFTYGKEAASTGSTEFTYCVQTAPAETTQFTYCVQTARHPGTGTPATPPQGVEGDADTGCWI